MRRIYLKFYDEMNFGDDILVEMLLQRYPQDRFYAYAWGKYAGRYKNLRVYKKESLFLRGVNKVLKMLFGRDLEENIWRRCDVLVYLGGSIFIEPQSKQTRTDMIRWWEGFAAAKGDKYVLDANFGPMLSDDWNLHFARILQKMTLVYWRDQYSLSLFEPCPNMKCGNDMAFAYRADKETKGERENLVVLNVMDVQNKEYAGKGTKADYMKALANIARQAQSLGYRVALLALCNYEGDVDACEELAEACPAIDFLKVYYSRDTAEVFDLLAGARFVLATRFHAAVLSMCLGVPVKVWAYSKKTVSMIMEAVPGVEWEKISDIDPQSVDNPGFIEKASPVPQAQVEEARAKAQDMVRSL